MKSNSIKSCLTFFIAFLAIPIIAISNPYCGDMICSDDENVINCMDCIYKISNDALIYGRITDASGKPLENQTIIAQWSDASGKTHSAKTKTFSESEALGMHDPSLKGFYIFTDKDISAGQGAKIGIKSEPYYLEEFVSLNSPIQTVNFIVAGKVFRPNENPASKFMKKLKNIGIWLANPYLLLISFLLILFFLAFYFNKKKAGTNKNAELNLFLTTKLRSIMTEKVITVNGHEPVNAVVGMMIGKRVNSVIAVHDGKPIGIVTEFDFLKKVYSRDYSSLLVRDVMTPRLMMMESSSSVAAGIKFILDNKIRKLPLVKGGRMVGIVTMTDILKFLNDYFQIYEWQYGALPLIDDVFNRHVTRIEKTAKIPEVIKLMIEKNSSFAVVFDGNISTGNALETSSLGIITTKDLLYNFYKNPESLKRLRVMHVMKQPLEVVYLGISIFEANKHMLYENFRRMPVVMNNSVVGVLKQNDVLRGVYNFIREKSKMEKHSRVKY